MMVNNIFQRRRIWMAVASVAIALLVASLMLPKCNGCNRAGDGGQSLKSAVKTSEPARLEGDTIVINGQSTFGKKLTHVTVANEALTTPLLRVTGSVIARLNAGSSSAEERWQFGSVELATIYTDWLKSVSEEGYARKHLAKVRELTASQIKHKREVRDRLQKLVASGTEPGRELATASAELLQAELNGQEETFAAESALQVATKNNALLEREIRQSGLDPQVLGKYEEEMVLVVANVPESKISWVQQGQECQARVYGYPDDVFTGHIEKLSPTLAQERQALRVLFHVTDPQRKLRPGMFAEIALGVDARQAILIPAEAVVHIGTRDYVLTQSGSEAWAITQITVGESVDTRVEVHSGLSVGTTIIGEGAVLLKPLMVQVLSATPETHDDQIPPPHGDAAGVHTP